MGIKQNPFIITFSHEKGGTGKSTLATHLAVGLMYYDKNFNVALLDLDNRQASSLSFFQNRQQYSSNVPMLSHCDKINSSRNDSKKNSYAEDFCSLEHAIKSLNHCDFIILDTPGSYSNFTMSSVYFADLLITPVTEGYFDINAILDLKKHEKNILNGPFYEIIFEQRKARKINGKSFFDWMLVINKASPLYQENSEKCKDILENLSKTLDFSVSYVIKDRQVYKELCNHGLTIFDLPQLTHDISMMKIKAHAEMDKFVFTVIDKFNKIMEVKQVSV